MRSIKRKMGQEVTVTLGDQTFTPQEVSAIILRTLKRRAESALGQPVSKAVITVPAFFNDNQRQATREAGELAGLEVVRIINEPTAAVLTYDPHPAEMERLLVYDLGGGTFDVSMVQVEDGVVEVLRQPAATPSSAATTSTSGCSTSSATRSRRSTGWTCGPARVAGPRAPRRRGGQEAALHRAGHDGRGGVHRREGRPAAQPERSRSNGTNSRS